MGSANGIQTFRPQVSILLRKNIGRKTVGEDIAASERFTGSKRTLDLTPYLGDQGSVTVTRSTREPAGMFSIALTDKMEPDRMDSLYGLIEPMDVIEIRMARDTADYAGAFPEQMPIMMRGFVSDVRREQSMTATGPRRSVVISGQDYGKILQIMRIIYLPAMPEKENLLTAFKLFLNYGINPNDEDAGEFVNEIVTKVINGGFLKRMRTAVSGGHDDKCPVVDLNVEYDTGSGVVSPIGSQDWPGGTIYDLLRTFGDVGAWNELYIDDREDGPYLIYRPTPFTDLSGTPIQKSAHAVSKVDIHDSELLTISVGRTDANVANYYWVSAARYSMISPSLLQAGAVGGSFKPDPFVDNYDNCSPDLYGTRVMQIDTDQGPRADGKAESDYDRDVGIGIGAINEKRRILLENNKNNIVLESGSMTLRGNEKIKHGCILRLTRGAGAGVAADHYAHTITHSFVPMRSFTTTVTFDRGMGFVKRIESGSAAAPYLAEMNVGGSYD